MEDHYLKFAEICKKYGLAKDEGTYELFKEYDSLIGGVVVWSKKEFEIKLKLAQIIRMLNKNKGISFTNGFDEIKIENGYILEELKAFLNTLLGRLDYCDGYKEIGINPKTRIRDDIVHNDTNDWDKWGIYKKYTPHKWNFTEPYSESEISSIIDYEKLRIKQADILEGRKPYVAPLKGQMALFLKITIEKYNLVEDVKLLVWDLLECLGYAESYGALMADNEKRQMVSNWIKALERAENKLRSKEFQPKERATEGDDDLPFVINEDGTITDKDEEFESWFKEMEQKRRMLFEEIMG